MTSPPGKENQCQETSEVELQQVAYPGVAGRFFGPLSLGKIMAFICMRKQVFAPHNERVSYFSSPSLIVVLLLGLFSTDA